MAENEHMKILSLIERGEISPEEGAKRLSMVGKTPSPAEDGKQDAMQVLGMVERGEINPAEAAVRLKTGASEPAGTQIRFVQDDTAARDFQDSPHVKRWQNWWLIPLWAGVGTTVLASLWMYSLLQSVGTNFWFYCSFAPFLMGVAAIALAWASRNSPWLHVRVRQSTKSADSKVAVSIPLPMRPAAWFLEKFGGYIPKLDKTVVDELISALDKEKQDGNPFYIEVTDDEDGEHVEVFIG